MISNLNILRYARVRAVVPLLAAAMLCACASSGHRSPAPCTAKDAERISLIVNSAIWNDPAHSTDRASKMTLKELAAEQELTAKLIRADQAAIGGDPDSSCKLFREIAAEQNILLPN
jgi:hypothetical protein